MGDAISGGFGDDLMLRLSPEMNGETKVSTSEQPDLTLGLSLGGIYCPKLKESSLTRSSSVIGVISQNAETWKWDMQGQQRSFLSLARSCSFPAETDQLGRIKLKELQLMRRMEAKKRLAEQRSGRAAAAEDEKAAAAPPSPSEVAAWAAASAARSPAVCRATDKIKSTQGSLSQNYTIEGHGSVGSTKGSSTSQSSLESSDREPQTMASREKPGTNAAKRCRVSKGLMEGDGGMDVMRTMPSVTTIGDGPNGRKIEGFLYKYMKGQVCIVCVCHGSFLTPAEFVKHAGGREVANPMKHIHVCCTSFSL
ncbi:ninja-family protein AFP3-like [Cucurbita maxima]|uniref:Ninja-family protein n=1 Tax=Cucurbita maxima TaxID=3661 RepID=A0A6J1K4M8_CUCMA|nr:ninja-family protein AFP3-like [Cucurbita maxima]